MTPPQPPSPTVTMMQGLVIDKVHPAFPVHLVQAVVQQTLGQLSSLARENYKNKITKWDTTVSKPELITWSIVMDWLLDLMKERNGAPERESIEEAA